MLYSDPLCRTSVIEKLTSYLPSSSHTKVGGGGTTFRITTLNFNATLRKLLLNSTSLMQTERHTISFQLIKSIT